MLNNKLVTVLTPTYNRASLLNDLYKSLTKQEVMNFDWLIIDDGSEDETEEVVKGFAQNRFVISYYKKINGGKHTAINYAMQYISTPLTIIVDSDDILLTNATKLIENYYQKYANEYERLCSLSFLRCYKDGKPIVSLGSNEFISDYPTCRVKENLPGDMAEVYFTDKLKKFRFPEVENEKFISEDVVWITMGEQYQTVYINIAIYQGAYLKGGLTDNDKPSKYNSPIGSMYRGLALMNKKCGVISNIKGAIIYDCYKIEAKRKYGSNIDIIKPKRKLLCGLMAPIGMIFNYIWRPKL